MNMSLTIRNTTLSDEGTYFCCMKSTFEIVFSSGTFLALKGFRDNFLQSEAIHDDSAVVQPSDQSTEAEMLNYAALSFSMRKAQKGRKKNKLPQEYLYSDVAQAMSVYQTSTVISAQLGDAVTLHCFFPEETSNDQLFWYKQRVGNKPQVVVVTNQVMNPLFYKEFEDSRFRLNKTKKSMSLTIGKTVPSDEAMYFCAKRSLYETEFSNGTFLAVKGDHQSSYISVQQISMSGSFYPGDSVTLQCTVLTERSSAELSVFWFRPTSYESRPVMIYTYKNRSDQCESGSPRQSCVYNLYKNSLSLSDAGTYYCAVATLGKIVIGDGAMLNIEKGQEGNWSTHLPKGTLSNTVDLWLQKASED
ncbi:uncharacterized protein LOC115818253 [Chanos chanos]|uniref:Uncharacterized protein LOC115818253 n=1 Tax=Chanos chanos TaxID=29144 RepID=A0A6J2W2B4_CHACN|nr:uncharacterized protein LOC115818253 [Chanos chanos]